MDSRSAYKNKRKLVTSHRRRISSILNQSPTKLNASKGDVNRKISVLIKNNKTLAIALEDAQCELSFKQKLLEKASEYFKNIMLARVKMTQMWSALNAVLQDFDVTVEMLKCDSFKLSDITPPFQSSGKLKKKMKKIAEAVGSVNEESSILFEQENKESDCENSAYPSIPKKNVSSNFCSVPMEVAENIADKTSLSSEPALLQASTKNCLPDSSSLDSITPGSPCAKSEALVDPDNKKEMTSVTSDTLIARNDTGTPKLSLPSALPMIDLQNNSGFAFSLLKEKDSSVTKKVSKTPEKKSGDPISLLKENDSSVKKFSKIPEALNKPKSSQKVLNSKIPRFHASRNTAIKAISLSDELSKGKSACPGIFNKENVSIPQEMNEIDCRRKTFVVKSSDPETAVDLNEEEVADMNNLEDEQNSETFTSRKTFVVRNSSALEKKRKSLNNKRKTFVKKCNKNNSPKSIKNRRGTFVLTDVNENCTEEGELLTAYSVSSECDDLVKEESNKPCTVSVHEAFPPDSNDPCKITQNLQLPKNNCFIIDNPEMKNQKSNSNELFLELNSEGTLKNKLENSSALEKECKSVNDKRKTFVKKCDKNNSRKSIKSKRGTFVLTDIDENCTEENQLLTNVVNSECDDLVKEKLNAPCAMAIDEALPSSSALETECKSVNDKRKTFVKKCEKNNSRKSIKNKRGTIVLTDIDENCTEEDQLLTNLVNSECDDLVKEKLNSPCAKTIDEALPSAYNNACEITKNIQLLKNNCITDKPRMKNQENIAEELLPEVSSDRALKEYLVKSSGIKDVNKLICSKDDTTVVQLEKQISEIDDLKSTILPQNPSIELRVQADRTTNEADRSTSEAKASKEEKINCMADGMECNKGNLLLKNSNRKKTCLTLSQDKHIASKIGTPEKKPAIPQTSSQEYPVHCSNNTKEESERKYVLEKEINNNEEGESSIKSIETNEKCKSGTKHAIDGNEKDETDENNLELVDISDDEIIILGNDEKKRRSRSRKIMSYKKFLEPSYSDCESISEVEDLENFEDEINSYPKTKLPIRGKVSFSKKKNYVFSREADKKIKPKKYLGKSKNCKNLSNELTSASALNRNCEDNNLNTDINQVSDENVGKLDFANPKEKKTEISSKRQVKFCDTRETIPNAVKITENSVHNRANTDIKIHKNSSPEILDGQNHKNVKKTILPSNYSPVISLDNCLNNIECDIGDKKDKSDKINFSDETIPKIQKIEADNANNIKKQTDSVNDKTSKKKEPKKNQPKKKKKQVIESDVGKENIEDSPEYNKDEVKPKSKNNKAKNNKEKKLAKNNAIVVEAEVHPLPRTLNQLDTNIENTMNYNVSVVLNDIFQSPLSNLLCVNNKENRDRNCVISSPLSNNSRNIQMQATNNSKSAKEEDNEDLTECRRSKRARAINYAEPMLNKKLRRDR